MGSIDESDLLIVRGWLPRRPRSGCSASFDQAPGKSHTVALALVVGCLASGAFWEAPVTENLALFSGMSISPSSTREYWTASGRDDLSYLCRSSSRVKVPFST
jgi:hypothetical protein